MKGYDYLLNYVLEAKHEWKDFINGNRELPSLPNVLSDFHLIVLYKVLKPEKASVQM